MKKLTIFTPTYNRAYTLPRLYNSLCNQSNKEFIWLIVDDGSKDNTKEIINQWINEAKIEIEYIYQENAGKAQAHNNGVRNTKTELFVCVDSDDYLTADAVETIIVEDLTKQDCVGALYKKGYSENKSVTIWNKEMDYSTLQDAYLNKGLQGDTMLVYKTSVIKQFEYPKIEGERFIPDAYLYDRIDTIGKLKFIDRILYVCEYLPDGYTSNIRRINATNPKGYCLFIEQRINSQKLGIPLVMNCIRLVAIKLVLKESIIKKVKHPFINLLVVIPGWYFYQKNYRQYVSKG